MIARRGLRPRAVFDCNALLQALFSDDGPAAESLRLMEQGRFELYINRLVLREFRTVLNYPHLRQKNPNLSDVLIDAYIERLRFRGTMIRQVPHVFDFPRDPSDEPYLDLSIASQAEYLVSSDKDIHWLMTGHAGVCARFRRYLPSIQIVTPSEFVERMQ